MSISSNNIEQDVRDLLANKRINTISQNVLKLIDERRRGIVNGVYSSWDNWNKFMGGCFSFGTFYVIGGRPGTGKSNRALQLIDDFCSQVANLKWKDKIMIIFWSAEMPSEQNVLRLFSRYSEMSFYKMLSTNGQLADGEYDSLMRMAERFNNYPFYIEDIPTAGDKMFKVNDVLRRNNPDTYVINLVDHSRLIPKSAAEERSEEERISNLCVMMNTSTKCHKSTWILLSQLNRGIESIERRKESPFPWPIPQMSDYFGADAVSQNAHCCSILIDPYEFAHQTIITRGDNQIVLKKVIEDEQSRRRSEHKLLIDYIIKNRNGAMGEIYNDVCWSSNSIKELGTSLKTGLG